MNFPSSTRTPPSLAFVVTLAAVIHCVSASFHVYTGGMNPDEGFYAIAARAVMHGEVPYRDFGYTQMPLLPYVNGPWLALTGYGLFEQRWLNGIWGALALVLASRWVARRTWPLLGVAFAVTFSLSPAWMYFMHLGKTYAFTSLVVIAATYAFVELSPGWKKRWLLGWLGVLGVGCRLPAAPFFAVLWLTAVCEGEGLRVRSLLSATLGLALAAVLLLLPFYALAPESSVFWTLKIHAAAVPQRARHLAWTDVATLAPIWWAALTAGFAIAVVRRQRPRSSEMVVVLAAFAALASNLIPSGVFEEYGTPFILPLAGAVMCGLARLVASWSPRQKITLVGGLAAIHHVAAPLLTFGVARAGLASHWLPPNVPAFDAELPAHIAEARRVVAALLPLDQPLIGPNIILAAETGHPVPRKLRMGPFSMTRDFSPADADRLHLLTYPELVGYFSRADVPLLAFSTQPLLNFAWSMPTFRNPSVAEREQWREIFRRDFVVAYGESTFWLLARRTALPAVAKPGKN